MSAYAGNPWNWTGRSAELLHVRFDNFLVLMSSMDCPMTDSQRLELGHLHEFIFNVHGELAHEAIRCDYTDWLSKWEFDQEVPRRNSL